MPDNIVLYGASGASAVNIGSWLRADPGPDFDPSFFDDDTFDSAAIDGGGFSFSRGRVRKFTFPLLLASGGAGLSLTKLESTLRLNARPGAYVDVQPDGVPSAESVRFDVIGGRWLPAYNVRHHRQLSRRMGSLELKVQPFGYWPTWITLASAVSATNPAFTPLLVASIIGDAPAPVQFVYSPSVATAYVGSQGTEGMVWSLGRPSYANAPLLFAGYAFTPEIVAESPGYVGTAVADSFLPGLTGTRMDVAINNPSSLFKMIGAWTVAREGRFRAFLVGRLGASYGNCGLVTFQSRDWPPNSQVGIALGSSGFVATVPPGSASGVAPWGVSPSPAHYLIDMGEISTPQAQGTWQYANNSRSIALHYRAPTVGLGTQILSIGGLVLVPLEGANGIMPRGMAYPTHSSAKRQMTYLFSDTSNRTISLGPMFSPSYKIANALQHYRGGFPMLGASTVDMLSFAFTQGSASTPAAAVPLWGPVAAEIMVSYRPTFQFLKGL